MVTDAEVHKFQEQAEQDAERAEVNCTKREKTYIFRPSSYALHPAILRVRAANGYDAVHYLTNSTYNRFVALANGDRFQVEILDADHGVAFELRRKPVAASAAAHETDEESASSWAHYQRIKTAHQQFLQRNEL